MKGKKQKVELTQAMLDRDPVNGKLYLNLKFRRETDSVISEIHVPKVVLPIYGEPTIKIPMPHDPFLHHDKLNDYFCESYHNTPTITFPSCVGNVSLELERFDKNGGVLTETIIEKKVHKMTLAEVEEKLGYKVELISGEDE